MNQIFLVARKDLRVEFRQKGIINTILLFSLLVMLVMYFSLNRNVESLHRFGPQALWISVLFSSFLGLSHFMQIEKQNDCLSALITSPLEPWKLYVGKVLSVTVILTIVELVLVPCFFLFFAYSFTDVRILVPAVLLLGNIGIAAVGTIFSGLLVAGRASEYLLPILLLPLLLPLLIAGIHATAPLLNEGAAISSGETGLNPAFDWIIFLIALDLIFLPAGSLLADAIYKP